MLKAVIFDLDGVLADSHNSHIRAWNNLLRSLDRRLTESDVELLRDGRKKEEVMRSLLGDLSKEDLHEYCRRKDMLFQKEMKNVTAVAGVETFLRQLRLDAVPMAVASSGSRVRVRQTLDVLRLTGFFQTIITGDDVTTGKSDAEIFCRAAQRLRVEPIDVLVFEDSISGIRAATAAGMKCVGIASGARAQALIHAGAVAVGPDFTGMAHDRMARFFHIKA